MVLAFKLYGDFHWPPLQKQPDNPKTASGTLEIHFVPKGGDDQLHTFLRWVPKGLETFDDEQKIDPPATDVNIYAVLDTWFDENKDKVAALWIDLYKETDDLDRVAFRGAFLIDQYRPDASGKLELDLRWPIVSSTQYRKGTTTYSELAINRRNKASIFRFNLHLPLPVRRTTLSTKANNNPAAFPFCAVYATRRPEANILDFTTLVGGWINSGPDDVLTSFVFNNLSSPKTPRLGAFGFSADARSGEKGFAFYDGNSYSDKPPTPVKRVEFWPKDNDAFVMDVMGRYGFGVSPQKADALKINAQSVADLSLRFKPGRGSGGGALIYRMAVAASKYDGDGNDDVRQSDAALSLRLKKESGGWLRTAPTVYVDCELSWQIAERDIWSADRDADWRTHVTVRLLWDETVKKTKSLAVGASETGDFAAGTLAQAAHSFEEARAALQSTESGQPQSFLPSLSVEKDQDVRFALYGSPIAARFNPQTNAVSWGKVDSKPEQNPTFIRPPMRLSLVANDDLIGDSDDMKAKDATLGLRAEDQTFFTSGGTILSLELSHDPSWPPTSEDTVADSEPFFASFVLATEAPKAGWQGRLSSLQFDCAADFDNNAEPPEDASPSLRAGGPGARHGMGHGAAPIDLASGRIAASIRVVVPVSRVEPAAVDVARTDRSGRPTPLLIPQNPSPSGPEIRFHLSATETISPTQDRLLEVDVLENSHESGDRSYVVLSQEPFSVLQFTHRPLGDRGDLGSASVAFYSSDDRIWQFRRVTDHYHYVLPPQVVGESADKPRRLEIHDLPDYSTEMPPRPFAGADATEGDLKRRAVEYRLTPPTELWIRPSDGARGYFMPESASYEIFRQRGEFGLGAPLAFIRSEFLYGLSVGIDVSKERSVARLARVAEIEALTGTIVGDARERNADGALRARWNDLSRALARRQERLEVWARDSDSAVDFTPARFSEGVSFALRATALHRAPLTPLESPADYDALPKVGGLKDTAETSSGKPRHHPQGLSGGALWPVESVNLFNVLLDRPDSSGGAIESIAFSPLGGDATQKAEFLNGIVSILSETRNGFIERQKVEVLGRICALWHRAKHVVVYERTVNPSAQFAPKRADDPFETRSRRPILRKVSEYIELLEPERSYPDFNNAVPRSAGFLERVRFNSRIINVDSAWSSEVGGYGWQIPLWNRVSARERPQVYPMPDVAFVTAAEGEGDKPVVAQECRDPDFLFFFADFKAGVSDTNQWATRLDLDYANMPTAQAIARIQDKRRDSVAPTSRGADQRQASVSRFLPGLRRFTWRLAPAAQKTAINAGRAGKPVYVGLDSVTFMRASHAADAQNSLWPDLGTLLGAVAGLKKPDKDPPTIKDLTYWDGKGNGSQVPGGNDFSTAVGNMRTALGAKPPVQADVKKALDALKGQWTASAGTYANVVVDDAKQRANDAKSFFEGLKGSLGGFAKGENPCDKLKSDAVGMIQRKEMLIRTALSDWTADAEAILPGLLHPEDEPNPNDNGNNPYGKNKPIKNKSEAIEALLFVSTNYLRPLFREASQDVGKAGEGVEKARAIILDLDAEFEAMVARARQRVEQFAAGYDREKPWSAERIKTFHAGLRACIGNVAADITALIDEARQRFAAELDDASQAIGGHLAKALSEIAQQRAGLLSDFGSLAEGLKRRLRDEARSRLDELAPVGKPGLLDDAIVKINAAIASVESNGTINATLRAKAKTALEALQAVAGDAKTTVSSARQQLDRVETLGDEAVDRVAAIIVELAGALTSVVTALAKKADEIIALAQEFADAGFGAISYTFKVIWPDVESAVGKLADWIEKTLAPLENELVEIGKLSYFLVTSTVARLNEVLKELRSDVRAVEGKITGLIDDVVGALEAAQLALAPERLLETAVREKVLRPAFEEVLKPLAADLGKPNEALALIRTQLWALSESIQEPIRKLTVTTLGPLEEVSLACDAAFEGVDKVKSYIEALANGAETYFDSKAEELKAAFDTVAKRIEDAVGGEVEELVADADTLLATVNAMDHSVRGLQNDLARSTETARMYADRLFSATGRLGEGGLMAAPSNVLKLYSAVTSAPELVALKADIDRIRSGFDELSDVIDTTEAKALFNRLGDELKALGLSATFDKIGDRLMLVDPSRFEINEMFRHIAGGKFDNLLKGRRLPSGLRDAIKITHDFDKGQARAWVRIDINAPISGRSTLFSVGPFKADFVDMMISGQVRLEASKDTDKITETGFGRIDTSIDVVVGGQSMVRFDKFALAFTREKGLDIEFDPKSIRLNPSFKFIQDFLSTLFPDEIGGLKVIKLDGMPIGIEHEFAIPPLALNFGTSGVSNISIENRFKLLAYPDFMLANRFNLSTVERPFIFSIFIIGGTGYVQIDAEYRPFDSELMVAVEAGAGGSASLAFAFGPFSGQVFITLSGVLTYRKVLGRPGGGLSIASVLVIAGHLNIAGIVTVGIVLMLRMTYRDDGQIDADGTLTVEIRISRFFKITARAGVKYKLRGGKSETTTETKVGVEAAPELQKKAKQLQKARS